jgi:hypothetical protein
VTPAQCTAPSRVICHQQTDCLASQTCAAPAPMPVSVSSNPSVQAIPWRVDYQVCAP